ncbi:PilZ domain-containing protein [Sphingobium sp. AN641]|uniref:PilZ domain-containing protein n=1 Tax=Sphingobium sp. AN641 TaxID=3133443 RepID=UPI0030BF8483
MGSPFANLNHVMRSRDPAVEARRAKRDLVDLVSHATARGCTHGIRVINLSPLGLMCRTGADLRLGERLTVWLPLAHDVAADIRWIEHGRIGMEFVTPISLATYDRMLTLMPARRVAW